MNSKKGQLQDKVRACSVVGRELHEGNKGSSLGYAIFKVCN